MENTQLAVIDEKAAARFLGISYATIRRHREAGTGPRWVRLSDRRLGYRMTDLQDWLEKRISA